MCARGRRSPRAWSSHRLVRSMLATACSAMLACFKSSTRTGFWHPDMNTREKFAGCCCYCTLAPMWDSRQHTASCVCLCAEEIACGSSLNLAWLRDCVWGGLCVCRAGKLTKPCVGRPNDTQHIYVYFTLPHIIVVNTRSCSICAVWTRYIRYANRDAAARKNFSIALVCVRGKKTRRRVAWARECANHSAINSPTAVKCW